MSAPVINQTGLVNLHEPLLLPLYQTGLVLPPDWYLVEDTCTYYLQPMDQDWLHELRLQKDCCCEHDQLPA